MDDGGSDFFIGGDDLLRNQQFRGPGGPRPWRGEGPGMRGRPPFDNFHRGFEPPHRGPPPLMGGPRFRGPPPRGGFGPGPGFMNRGGMMMRGGPPGPMFRHNRPPMRFRPPDPGMDEGEEIWAETASPNDGKVYFYNVRTRVTSWSKPEGPNVRIVTHDEWARMTASRNETRDDDIDGTVRRNPFQPEDSIEDGDGMEGQHYSREREDGGNQFVHGTTSSPFSDMPGHKDGSDSAPTRPPGLMDREFSPPHMSDLPPGLQTQFPPPTAQQAGQNAASAGAFSHEPPAAPSNFNLTSQEQAVTGQQGHAAAPPVSAAGPPFAPFMGMPPPLGMPPPGMGGHGPGSFPNFTMMPPPWTPITPSGVPPPMLQQIDQTILAAAFEWSEHTAPDGRMYYYHGKTQKSVWEKPQALIDLDQAKSALMLAAMQAHQMQQVTQMNQVPRNPSKDFNENAKKESAKKAEKKAVEKCRPVSSTPVPGTPWCVVWTGDRRVFFYNPLNKQSVWERPSDLIGRVDVEELVRNCPADKPQKVKKVEATSTTSPVLETKEENGKSEVAPGDEAAAPPPKKKKKRNSTASQEATEDVKQAIGDDQSESNDKIKIETKEGPKEVSASEVEQKAAKERATIPLEIRLKQFHEMLIEKEVSAFSTWEKELHKIVYDSRYLLLTSKERKQSFDNFVKERAEEEKYEKKQKQKENRANFFKFLKEINVTPKMTYNDFTQKYGREDRYKLIEKPRDREMYFADYIYELKQKEKKDAVARKEEDREAFTKLLKEKITDYHMKWSEAKKKIDGDSRYSAVESEDRESLYKSFCKHLKSEIKAREKRRKKERKEAKRKSQAQGEKGETEVIDLEKESDNEKEEGKPEDGSEEEEGCISEDSDETEKAARERKEREEQSIREREKEVQKSLASHLRDRDKERDHHRHDEAVQELQALLNDLVRNTDMGWKDAKKILKEDRRWETVTILGREEMEDLYNIHLDSIGKKKRQRFRELLDEANIQLDTEWKDIRKLIKDDPRYLKFSSNERKCEREFEMYLKDIHAKMKNDFRELLKETKSLTYRTRCQITSNTATMREIDSVLAKDKRWHQMDRFVHVREKMLMDYIEELERKGPPPPPTSTRADMPPPSSSQSVPPSRKFK